MLGIYALDPEALTYLVKDQYMDMPTLFSKLKSSHFRTIVYPMHESWMDIGRPDDLVKANLQDTQN
jgi:NDP-sugar pyrophosphorylase family protein